MRKKQGRERERNGEKRRREKMRTISWALGTLLQAAVPWQWQVRRNGIGAWSRSGGFLKSVVLLINVQIQKSNMIKHVWLGLINFNYVYILKYTNISKSTNPFNLIRRQTLAAFHMRNKEAMLQLELWEFLLALLLGSRAVQDRVANVCVVDVNLRISDHIDMDFDAHHWY